MIDHVDSGYNVAGKQIFGNIFPKTGEMPIVLGIILSDARREAARSDFLPLSATENREAFEASRVWEGLNANEKEIATHLLRGHLSHLSVHGIIRELKREKEVRQEVLTSAEKLVNTLGGVEAAKRKLQAARLRRDHAATTAIFDALRARHALKDAANFNISKIIKACEALEPLGSWRKPARSEMPRVDYNARRRAHRTNSPENNSWLSPGASAEALRRAALDAPYNPSKADIR